MWDIKAKISIEMDDFNAKYYLNHVGYKDHNRGNTMDWRQLKYYLNHVGYKGLK